MAGIGAFRPFPHVPANVPSPNNQQTLSVAARTAIACDRPPGIVGSVLAGDTIVGDREPQRLVDDECVRVGADAGIIVECRQRDAIERHGGKVGWALRECSSNFTSTRANRISIVKRDAHGRLVTEHRAR